MLMGRVMQWKHAADSVFGAGQQEFIRYHMISFKTENITSQTILDAENRRTGEWILSSWASWYVQMCGNDKTGAYNVANTYGKLVRVSVTSNLIAKMEKD